MIIKDKQINLYFGLSLAMVVMSAVVASLGLPVDTGDIIIQFDNYHDEVIWAGSVGVFFGIVLMAALIVVINYLLARHIYEKEHFMAQLLGVGTIIVTGLFLLATFSVALIN